MTRTNQTWTSPDANPERAACRGAVAMAARRAPAGLDRRQGDPMNMRTFPLARVLPGIASVGALAALSAMPASADAMPMTASAAKQADAAGELREIRSPGFLFVDGRYTTIQIPRSRTHTYAHGINDRGLIAGGFDNPSSDGPNGRIHGMVLRRDGNYLRFDVRGAVGTIVNKINDRRQTVGGFHPTSVSVGTPGTKGFLRGPRGVRVIDVPGSIETQALGINNHGLVVGEYVDSDGVFHGYRWKRGRFTTIDGPGSLGGAVTDVNDRGHMVGAYFTQRGGTRGFLLRNGVYRTFNVPYGPLDLPTDINNRGQIVGSTLSDPVGTQSVGFALGKGVNGPFTRIRFPGSPQTIARGIDDRGRIVGLYGNPDATTAQRTTAVPSLESLPLVLTDVKETR
jgi:hypothetical protein